MRRTTMLWEVFVRRFEEAFEQYRRHRLTGEEAGELLGMSGRHFRRLFVARTGGSLRRSEMSGVGGKLTLDQLRVLTRRRQQVATDLQCTSPSMRSKALAPSRRATSQPGLWATDYFVPTATIISQGPSKPDARSNRRSDCSISCQAASLPA